MLQENFSLSLEGTCMKQNHSKQLTDTKAKVVSCRSIPPSGAANQWSSSPLLLIVLAPILVLQCLLFSCFSLFKAAFCLYIITDCQIIPRIANLLVNYRDTNKNLDIQKKQTSSNLMSGLVWSTVELKAKVFSPFTNSVFPHALEHLLFVPQFEAYALLKTIHITIYHGFVLIYGLVSTSHSVVG